VKLYYTLPLADFCVGTPDGAHNKGANAGTAPSLAVCRKWTGQVIVQAPFSGK